MALQTAPRSIVILRALQLGDLLCTVPSFRALRAAFPQARITLIGLPWAEGFVRRFSSYLDDFIEFPGWPGLPEREPEIQRIPAFLQQVQAHHFDLALQMQGSGTITNPLVSLFSARQTAGYYLPGQFCPDPVTYAPYPKGGHEIYIFLHLLAHLGIPAQGDHLEFPLTNNEKETFQRFQQQNRLEAKRYICLHPGARYSGRRWSPEKFAAVGDALTQSGYQVVITGTETERHLTEAVAANMHHPALDIAGKTDMPTVALLLANARLLISNDTGLSHIASALRVPSVILFNASDPSRWRPLDQHLHRVVMNANSVAHERVLAEAASLLQEAQAYDD